MGKKSSYAVDPLLNKINPCGVKPGRTEECGDVLSVHLFPVLTSHLRVDANEMSIINKRRCYQCKEWGDVLSSPQWFKNHVKTHIGENHRCKRCRKPFRIHSCVQRNLAGEKSYCMSRVTHNRVGSHKYLCAACFAFSQERRCSEKELHMQQTWESLCVSFLTLVLWKESLKRSPMNMRSVGKAFICSIFFWCQKKKTQCRENLWMQAMW